MPAAVQRAAAEVTGLFIGAFLFSAAGLFHCAVLNGMGRTSSLALVAGVGAWGINIPLMVWLALKEGMGLQGVWYAAIVAEVCVCVCVCR